MTAQWEEPDDDYADEPLNDTPADDVLLDEEMDGDRESLWEGDEARLSYAQRKTFVALLKHRFITAEKHPEEWRTLLDSTDLLRSRLNDLFLELHIDPHRQVAFKRQAVPEGGNKSFPTLLHNVTYSREETILLTYLRQKFRSDSLDGQVFVDREELLEYVGGFRPDNSTDHSMDTRKTSNAIDAIRKAGMLIPKADGDRFQVSPVIDVLITQEKLEDLLRWLIVQNGELEDDNNPAEPTEDALFETEEE